MIYKKPFDIDVRVKDQEIWLYPEFGEDEEAPNIVLCLTSVIENARTVRISYEPYYGEVWRTESYSPMERIMRGEEREVIEEAWHKCEKWGMTVDCERLEYSEVVKILENV